MNRRNLTVASIDSSGVVATERWQGSVKQLEKPSMSRREIFWSKVNPITVNSGKGIEDERVADGSVVAMSRSNVRGAKGPCC